MATVLEILCKSVAVRLRWFESTRSHQNKSMAIHPRQRRKAHCYAFVQPKVWDIVSQLHHKRKHKIVIRTFARPLLVGSAWWPDKVFSFPRLFSCFLGIIPSLTPAPSLHSFHEWPRSPSLFVGQHGRPKVSIYNTHRTSTPLPLGPANQG